jgi:hypothetical protein
MRLSGRCTVAIGLTDADASATRRVAALLRSRAGWVTAGLIVLSAVLFVSLTRMQPQYDAYGWLVWGRQALHWNLDTNGAPSWKPLTFLFTFPYALAGSAQPFLWMVTSVAAALAAPLFAGRIAYRLVPGPLYARAAAAAFAGVGVLGIAGYWPLVLIASSDPMIVALCLGAIDAHLSGRPRVAFGLLVLAALGRPEAWPFLGVYAIWMWRAAIRPRAVVLAGLAAIPALWFGISALTAKSWLRAGEVALGTAQALHNHTLSGVLDRYRGLYELPMQLAGLAGIALAVVSRARVALALAGLAASWIVIEIAFAFHGWPAEARYMAEPAAVAVVLGGYAVGRLLAWSPGFAVPMRVAAGAVVGALLVALVPVARQRVSVLRAEITQRQQAAVRIARLRTVVARDGGPDAILDCGTPDSLSGDQSILAYVLGLNVGVVGHKPGRDIRRGGPLVLFEPREFGWEVLPIHIPRRDRHSCDRLRATTAFGLPTRHV